ncbi:MAG: HD-GYP domain-containing protein [Deltaproteobacteria bacterium]|jgi:putative nucleotidyltransferase with HDIG domain|nr:HD-GYP domain-containing protein [Deltaproteobacteria bacterium]
MIRKIPTKSLEVGMFVSDVGRAWFNHPWKTKSKYISDRSEIEELIRFGIDEVYIDTQKTLKPSSEKKLSAKDFPLKQPGTEQRPARVYSNPAPPKPDPVSALEQELPRAAKAYNKALDTSKALVAACRMNKRIEINAVQENVDELVESVSRNPDALTALIKLRRFDDYTYTHSLNVSVLSISSGKALGLSDSELKVLGMGTMFHDLGKCRVPAFILNKPDKLTDDEFVIMKNHAALSADILIEQKLPVDDMVIKVARHHHERMDGSGYPDHLKGPDIPNLVTICGLSDVYDALTSDRVYHKGMLPHEALKFIYGLRGTHFQPEWVDRFVQSVGIYPPGSVVELNTGHVAVVMEVNHASLLNPLIKIVAEPNGQLYPRPKLLDLQQPENKGFNIQEVITPKKAGFDPAYYFNIKGEG